MKIIAALILALSVVNATGLQFVQQPLAQTDLNSDYSRCIDILQKIIDESAELSKYVLVHEYAKIVPLALHILENIYNDVKCFQNPDAVEITQKFVVALVKNVMEPNECQMTHLKNAIAAFKIAIADIKLHLYKEAGAQLKIILAEAEAAALCPQ